jgi:hypothetical protein
LLDWLLLQRIRDLWAHQSKRQARARAEQITAKFKSDMDEMSDITILIIKKTNLIVQLIFAVGALDLSFHFLTTAPDSYGLFDPLSLRFRPHLEFAVILVLAAGFLVSGFLYKREREVRYDVAKYRLETLGRLRNLLTAAGLGEDEIEVWLSRLPQVPRSSSLDARPLA